RFSRTFHDAPAALCGVMVYVALYPLSIVTYRGQLTDPLSHALFAWALVCIVEDRWLRLTAVLALGVLAKETVAMMVPVYLACTWHSGRVAWIRTASLGLACTAAFLAARLPLGWLPKDHRSLNDTELMIGSNLGFGGEAHYGTF